MHVVETRSYGTHRLQIADQGKDGWAVMLYGSGNPEKLVMTFSSANPGDLPRLLKEAEEMASSIAGSQT